MGGPCQRVPEAQATGGRGDLRGAGKAAQKARFQGNGSLHYQQAETRLIRGYVLSSLPSSPRVRWSSIGGDLAGYQDTKAVNDAEQTTDSGARSENRSNPAAPGNDDSAPPKYAQ